tara:strand:+ start:84 stop:257 length:174 start_codon:yes stop_codon:yes gene_type:complete
MYVSNEERNRLGLAGWGSDVPVKIYEEAKKKLEPKTEEPVVVEETVEGDFDKNLGLD